MDLLDELERNDLPNEQKELADCLGGLEIYKNFIRAFGGSNVYAVKPDTLIQNVRNRHIISEFNGSNYKEIAYKYSLSEVSVRRIINESRKERKS